MKAPTLTYTKGRERKMGCVLTTMVVSNVDDEALARRGIWSSDQVRRLTIDDVLVDTGATHLSLPADLIGQLGLDHAYDVAVSTATGSVPARVFRGANLTVEGRSVIVDCLELPGGKSPLLGVFPLEALGLELDLQGERLVLLPRTGPESYVTAL